MAKIKMFNGKKSQFIFIGLMLAILTTVAVIALIEPLKLVIDIARDADHLNCAATNLSVGTASTCIITDFYMLSFVGVSLGAGLAFLTGVGIYNRIRQS